MIHSPHGKALAGLLPPVSYDPNGQRLALALEVDGRTLDRIHAKATQLAAAVDVQNGKLIAEWERVCGLSANAAKPLAERVAKVVAKLNQQGSLSLAYLAEMAAQLGYQITFHELEPFRAGINRCGDRLWDESVKWLFCVDLNCPASATGYEPAPLIQDPILSALLEEIKPAFSLFWVRDFGAMK